MKIITLQSLLVCMITVAFGNPGKMSSQDIMDSLELDSNGKTEVVKAFPDSFPDVLVSRGQPLIYTKDNSENFEYIGMPIGGLCAGQLYLGGDGKLWFWDIFNLNYRRGQLKGEEAYQYPYVRNQLEEKGARMIEQGFSIRVKSDDVIVTKNLDRDGINDIEFLGQYPIGQVTYRDPELPVEVKLEAFSPFIPLNLENSILPATVINFTVKNTSDMPVEAELSGWMENAVLIESRNKSGLNGKLVNRLVKLSGNGRRLEYSVVPVKFRKKSQKRPDILFEDFENGYSKWTIEGNAFESDGKPYYHQESLKDFKGKRLADSFKEGDEAQGKLISRPFRIERPYVNCLVGGGKHSEQTCINIKVDHNVIASATGVNSEVLRPVTLNVSQYAGKDAVIEIVDAHRGGWGHVLVDQIVFTDEADSRGPVEMKKLPDYGTMSLALLNGSGDSYSDFTGLKEQQLNTRTPLVGQLGRSLTVAPGAQQDVTFLLTWHFPTTWVLRKQPGTRYYAKRFEDSAAVSDYIIRNFDELTSATRLWRDTWYDSTLPYWFLDRTFLNTSILASSTSSLIGDRLFYGWEGGYQGYGTCTHVWGYVQAMGRLFPDLEKSLREQVDFKPQNEGGAMLDNGQIHFRWWTNSLAVDGQSGCILRAYLCHQMSKDNAFLKRIYPGMKKAMQGLTEARDADHDGILTGGQHNTLDADWYGKVTWLSLHYTAALRAAAEMAGEMGDAEYATFCRQTAEKGRKYIEDNLFNGEYFFHEADPEHPTSPGTYTGLEYSQLFGQSWAYQVGLGEIIDPVKAKTALESMWRYNFSTDVGPFRQVHKGGRWYAMPGEGGLIACTWPRGGSEVLKKGNPRFAAYNNECQNGYEYAATSLMMWHDMPYHSLAHIWYMHNNRYHGSKRNPWCEIEWGLHYSRSMASYGHFVGACGFEYHGPRGSITFAPQVAPEDFKAAFTAAQGWGTYQQKRTDKNQTSTIQLQYGELKLHTLKFEVPEGRNIKKVKVSIDGKKKIKATFKQEGDEIEIEMTKPMVFTAGDKLQIEMR